VAEELDKTAVDQILAAVRAECDAKGFTWPPESPEAVGAANTVIRLAGRLLERERSSRQAWAEEAMRLRRELAFELRGINVEMEDFFLHVGDRVEFLRPDGRIARGEVVDVDPVRVMADDTGNVTTSPSDLRKATPCACPPEGAVFPAPWTPPQCAVHPGSEVLACGHTRAEAERSIQHELCDAPAEVFGSSSVLPDGEAQ
jgi:hypothetical protein